jgi:glycosyltransferase involved in cell wall biosynthesis
MENCNENLVVCTRAQEPTYVSEKVWEKSYVSVFLTAYNEADTINRVLKAYYDEIVTKLPSRLIVAEDGSDDNTPQIINSLKKEIPLAFFSERKRKGYAKGVGDGLKKCPDEWIFFSDSDDQYSPEDFWKLWDNRHGNDMVIGCKIQRKEEMHRIILSKGFHDLVNALFGLNLKDGDCGFRLIRKNVIDSVLDETSSLKYSFWTEFTIRASLKGFKIAEVPINHASRKNGASKIYVPSKIPFIVLRQLTGLITLFSKTKKSKV